MRKYAELTDKEKAAVVWAIGSPAVLDGLVSQYEDYLYVLEDAGEGVRR